jgi:hypothetical protein
MYLFLLKVLTNLSASRNDILKEAVEVIGTSASFRTHRSVHDTTTLQDDADAQTQGRVHHSDSISIGPPPFLYQQPGSVWLEMWKPLQSNKAVVPSSSKPAFASYTPAILQPTPLQLPSPSDADPLIGPLPVSIFARILNHLPVPDIPNVARTCRALAKIVRSDERVWRSRCLSLGLLEDLGREETDDPKSLQRNKCKFRL